MSGNSKEAYNTLKALTKTHQHKSAVVEGSNGNILSESRAVLNQWTVAYASVNSVQTRAYSGVTSPPHKRLKRLKTLC